VAPAVLALGARAVIAACTAIAPVSTVAQTGVATKAVAAEPEATVAAAPPPAPPAPEGVPQVAGYRVRSGM
jgi:hypothetical protein